MASSGKCAIVITEAIWDLSCCRHRTAVQFAELSARPFPVGKVLCHLPKQCCHDSLLPKINWQSKGTAEIAGQPVCMQALLWRAGCESDVVGPICQATQEEGFPGLKQKQLCATTARQGFAYAGS